MNTTKTKKFILLTAMLLAFTSLPVFSQVSCDPSSTFYDLAQAWKLRGVVDYLPPLRPYPLENIKSILRTVIERGDENDVKTAQYYWKQVTGKPWTISAEANLTFRTGNKEQGWGTGLLEIYPAVSGDLALFNNYLSLGYHMGLTLRNDSDTEFLSAYTNSSHDSILNSAQIWGMSGFLDVNDTVAYGSEHLFLQAGIYRSGYGLYLNEGLALNDSSYHRANFSFTYLGSSWAYTQQLSVLGATMSCDGIHESQSYIFPDKFLAFHSISFEPWKILHLSLYECMVYGMRFDPSYFFPLPYIVAQELNGFKDNSLIGFSLVLNPYKGFAWANDLLVDKLSLNDIFEWNITSNNRFAFKTGFIYTPENSFCTRMQTNYTLITPYMYSHEAGYTEDSSGTVNFQNYTNNGICIGSSYPPNSDCVTFSITFLPLPNLKIEIDTFYMRHANSAENLSTEEAIKYLTAGNLTSSSDGSLFNISPQNEQFGLLTQENLMYTIHAGIHSTYVLPRFVWGHLSFTFGYTFEYIKNKGVDSTIYPNNSIKEVSAGTYSYEGTEYTAEEIVAKFKKKWTDSFSEVLKSYITFGISYRF